MNRYWNYNQFFQDSLDIFKMLDQEVCQYWSKHDVPILQFMVHPDAHHRLQLLWRYQRNNLLHAFRHRPSNGRPHFKQNGGSISWISARQASQMYFGCISSHIRHVGGYTRSIRPVHRSRTSPTACFWRFTDFDCRSILIFCASGF